jgi:hypothetical protein
VLPSSSAAKSTKPKSAKKTKAKKGEEDDDDDDKLLESFSRLNTVCNNDGCKLKTTLLWSDCDHCRLRFCLGHGHGLPEAHGCGDEAKKAARKGLFKLEHVRNSNSRICMNN